MLLGNDPKITLAAWTVAAAIGFGIAGTVIAPMGIIDSSILYLIAQLLIFAATMCGFGTVIGKITELLREVKRTPVPKD